MCKVKSSQKDKSRPVGRFLESFFSKSRGFNDVKFIFLELMPAA